MNISDIEKAISYLEPGVKYNTNVHMSLDSQRVALEILQNELDRMENKSLTLDELKERQGKFVWYKFCGAVKGVVKVRVVFDSGTVEIDDYLINANNTLVEFYDYEPQEVTNERTT